MMGRRHAAIFSAAVVGFSGYLYCAPQDSKVRLFAWGSSHYGQLGMGDSTFSGQGLPAEIKSLVEMGGSEPLQMSAGGQNVALLTRTGEVYTWGKGTDKVLGIGDRGSAVYPQLVDSLLGKEITQVAASSTHVLALGENGDVFSWGKRALGRDGEGLLPDRVIGLPDSIVSVAAGKNHSLAITEAGQLFAWGSGASGALGFDSDEEEDRPVLVTELADHVITEVAAGDDFSLLLTDDGKVLSCGSNAYGQLGQGASIRSSCIAKPLRALAPHKVVGIAAGFNHAACVTMDGHAFTWGMGSDGQIGNGLRILHNYTPYQVSDLESISRVSCGGGHTAAITSEGKLYIWGRGHDGQLGGADQLEAGGACRMTPRLVHYFVNSNLCVMDACLGGDFSMAIAKSRE